jgi:hypothetical protein
MSTGCAKCLLNECNQSGATVMSIATDEFGENRAWYSVRSILVYERLGRAKWRSRVEKKYLLTTGRYPFWSSQLRTDIRRHNERCRETANEHEFTMESTIDSFVVDRRNVVDGIPGTSAGVGSESSN